MYHFVPTLDVFLYTFFSYSLGYCVVIYIAVLLERRIMYWNASKRELLHVISMNRAF